MLTQVEDTVTLYGLPLSQLFEKVDSAEPDRPSFQGDGSLYEFLYFGFKLINDEVRRPTGRAWSISKKDVLVQGNVEGFEWDGKKISFYTVKLTTEIIEQQTTEVNLAIELSRSPNIFASRYAVLPEPCEPSDSLGLSHSQTEAAVHTALGMGRPNARMQDGSCNTYRQTYTQSRYSKTARFPLDPWGGDCD